MAFQKNQLASLSFRRTVPDGCLLPQLLLLLHLLSLLFESPLPGTSRPWHRLDWGRLWSSNLLPQIGTASVCCLEISCLQTRIIQVCLELCESRPRGKWTEQNPLPKMVGGRMEEKGNGSSSGAQEAGILSNLLDCSCLWLGLPMVGGVPEKLLCRKVVACACF